MKNFNLLFINPWIYDFAAYDLWNKPIGLLKMAQVFKSIGCNIRYIDCLERNIPDERFGKGKYNKQKIEKPESLKQIPRNFNRYGIPEWEFEEKVGKGKKPDCIFITSGMTYWYPGVVKCVQILRIFFKDVPIVLGGNYATLCQDHAKKRSGADAVIEGANIKSVLSRLSKYMNRDLTMRLPTTPAWELVGKSNGVAVRTKEGCPYHCGYCASKVLYPKFLERPWKEVSEEIQGAVKSTGATNLAFYDDALLWNAEEHLARILNDVISKGIRLQYHCPNGLHINKISSQTAKMLKEHRFKTIRLGFESSTEDVQELSDRKTSNEEFVYAVGNLLKAGYQRDQIGVYILAGLPGQKADDVERSIEYVFENEATPYIAEYSPVPGTKIWEKAVRTSTWDLENEPLYQNNSIMPCRWDGFRYEDLVRIKKALINEKRKKKDMDEKKDLAD